MELTKIQIVLDDSGKILSPYSITPVIGQYATNYILEVAFKNKYEENRKYRVVFNINGTETPARVLSPTDRTITLDDGTTTANIWEYQLTQYETQYYQDTLEFSIITSNDETTIGIDKVNLDMVKNHYHKLTPVNLETDSSINSIEASLSSIGHSLIKTDGRVLNLSDEIELLKVAINEINNRLGG